MSIWVWYKMFAPNKNLVTTNTNQTKAGEQSNSRQDVKLRHQFNILLNNFVFDF